MARATAANRGISFDKVVEEALSEYLENLEATKSIGSHHKRDF
jgi:hypothetical protein